MHCLTCTHYYMHNFSKTGGNLHTYYIRLKTALHMYIITCYVYFISNVHTHTFDTNTETHQEADFELLARCKLACLFMSLVKTLRLCSSATL